jgi:hypothetical protein
MKPHLLRFSYFVWIVVPVVLYGAYAIWGLPHFIWSYEFRGSYSDWSRRHYTRCTFVGPYGSRTTYPVDGRCPWLLFTKEQVQ